MSLIYSMISRPITAQYQEGWYMVLMSQTLDQILPTGLGIPSTSFLTSPRDVLSPSQGRIPAGRA